MNNDMEKINTAFETLKKEGYFAQGNYMCCSSCALASLRGKDRYVFFNEQTHLNVFRNGPDMQDDLWLKWNGDANRIVQVLLENGLNASWNGDSDMGIKISPHETSFNESHEYMERKFTTKKNMFNSFISNKAKRFIDVTNKYVQSDPFFETNAAAMLSLLYLYGDQTGNEIGNIGSVHEFHKLLSGCSTISNAQECYNIYKNSVFHSTYQDYLNCSEGMSEEQAQEENGWLLNGDNATLAEINVRFQKVDKSVIEKVLEMDEQMEWYVKNLNNLRFNDHTNEGLIEIETHINNYLSSNYKDERIVQGLMLVNDRIQRVKAKRADLAVEGKKTYSLINKIKKIFIY